MTDDRIVLLWIGFVLLLVLIWGAGMYLTIDYAIHNLNTQ